MVWCLYVWERSLSEDSLGNNTRKGKHSKSAVGNFLQLHLLNVSIRLSPEQTSIQSKVSRRTSRSLQHLLNGKSINNLQKSPPKENLTQTSLLDTGIVRSGGRDALERLGDRKDAKTAVDGDPSEPRHHADAAVLELGLAEEIDGGEVGETEWVESDVADVSLAVGRGFEEGKGLGLGAQGVGGLDGGAGGESGGRAGDGGENGKLHHGWGEVGVEVIERWITN